MKMKINMYTILDAKSSVYDKPMYYLKDGEALRDLKTAVQDPKTKVNRYPEDFQLFCVGAFDTDSGMLIPEQKPRYIGKALDYVSVPVEEYQEPRKANK